MKYMREGCIASVATFGRFDTSGTGRCRVVVFVPHSKIVLFIFWDTCEDEGQQSWEQAPLCDVGITRTSTCIHPT